MLLVKAAKVSNASRALLQPKLIFLPFKIPRPLRISLKSVRGRSSIGRVICRSKKSRKYFKCLPRPNYTFTNYYINFTIGFYWNIAQTKLWTLVFSLHGGLYFIPSLKKLNIFSFNYKKSFNYYFNNYFKTPTLAQLRQLKPMTSISHIEPFPKKGAIYARSAGVRAIFISYNFFKQTVLIKLPSTLNKVFPLYSLALLGHVAFKEKSRTKSTKYGLWLSKGKGYIVRGVAKNPIDHPHGGRTKSIRYPRTPWGKTTKFK